MFRRIALLIGNVLLFWAATMVALMISGAIAGHGTKAMAVTGAIAAPASFGLTLLFVRWQHGTLADFGFEISRKSWLRFCIGFAFGAFLISVQTAIMGLGGGVKWVAETPRPEMLLSVVGYLLLAIREELAFRGYPLRLLASRINPWLALLIVASFFIIEHKLGGASWPDAVVGSGLGALAFGMAALATEGLALPIGMHAAWNIGDWIRGGKGDGGFWRIIIEPSAATHAKSIAWASYAGVMLCAFTTLVFWQGTHRQPSE